MLLNLNWVIMLQKQPKIDCVKEEDTIDHSTVTKSLKKKFFFFCLGCKNLDNQARSCRFKTMDSKAMLQVKEANLLNSTLSTR